MKKLFTILILLTIVISCKKWVSEDISELSTQLLSPSNNHQDSIQNQQFWWEEVEGANEYQIQIVSPAFDSVVTSAVDSIVDGTSLNLTLLPGTYQWRVRGVNNDYESQWDTRSFTIKSTVSLTGQNIIISTPTSGLNTNVLNHTITWNSLASASSYLIDVLDSVGTSVNVYNTANNSYAYVFPKVGLFTIKVQGLNDVSASFAAETKVLVDTTAPGAIELTFPQLDTIKSFPSSFTWGFDPDQASAITQNLIISRDSIFTDLILDTVLNTQQTITFDTIPHVGKLYWKVNRSDAAGNVNNTTDFNSFWTE